MPATESTLFGALAEGSLRFAYGMPFGLFLALALGLIVCVSLGYRKTTRPLSPGWRASFISLRSLVLILLLFCLLRPVVVSLETAPQETFFAVLVDRSASMGIADAGSGETRRQVATAALDDNFIDGLQDDYQLRFFGFGGTAERLANLDNGVDESEGRGAEIAASATSVGNALRFVEEQLSGLPLAGILLVSDGADNSGQDPSIAARQLEGAGVPVFTLGVGAETIPYDVGIQGVFTDETVLEGSVFLAQVRLSQQGFDGARLQLVVREEGVEVARREVVLAASDVTQTFELELNPEREEAIVYEVEATMVESALASQELVLQNNRYQFLVDNSPKPALDILFIEGHPRNEYKFIQRAVRGDSSLRLATYLRTGPEKFYRQGIESPTELSDGFPRERETLFDYEAIILGDIEREFFDAQQLQLLDDFVAERGGGLLLSGSVDPDFIGTAVESIAPVSLVEESFLPAPLRGGIRRGDHPTGGLYQPTVTPAGRVSPLLRLAADEASNTAAWAELPSLQGVVVTGRAKPGATVLLEHPTLDYQNQSLPVVVSQRYGSGRSMSVATASTWRWQMMLPAADQSQEKLWRQWLRWLAVSAEDRTTLRFDREFYHVGDTVRVEARVLDAEYIPDNDATLWLQHQDPQGAVSDLPMQWQLDDEGVYVGEFVAGEEGIYDLVIDVASAAGEGRAENASKSASLVVTPSLREYANAGLDEGVLQRIAATTGGSYAPISRAADLAQTIRSTPNTYSKEVVTDLWDSPWILALLVILLSADWALRRTKGLS